ncbi:hypothetical protein [Endozoicomonas sp. SCSIO W0465]|uniref:hypothetical protein n=1 Tax=Endozoicomonas sp. SCSIO W0465 TaxID=2918516 RepID=UPI002075570C|nr:hypothetical protein [Endozoicomonas sp. SCSIO W0465]USE38949.1 hypothetical protein MJO57_12745 [Endozoicomonas sp. SCSIO W0465]
MIPLIALITGSAKSLLAEELSPVDPINQLNISLSDAVSATQHLPIYPIPSPAVLYFSASCITNSSSPINSKELNEYQVVQVDDTAIPCFLSGSEIDTEDPESISLTASGMPAEVSPETSSKIAQPPGFHDSYSLIKEDPPSDPWPQGLLSKDDHINYGDLSDWLNDLNGIYDEESVFRSILDLPYPSEQSQLFPDHVIARPTYGWVVDNLLTDWINDRIMRISTSDQGEPLEGNLVEDNNESQQQAGPRETFDQIYLPFLEMFDHQDEEQAKAFFQKLYELLAPLRGLLVIAITGVNRPQGSSVITKGQRLSKLLNQSGIPASNIRVITSHNHSYVLAKRSSYSR